MKIILFLLITGVSANMCWDKITTCVDTNVKDGNIITDGEDGCAEYNQNTAWCGRFDTDDFLSGTMCCGCDGGLCPVLPSVVCTNTNGSSVNELACVCGDTSCTQNLRCYESNNFCSARSPCTNTNGTIVNTDTCVCGNTDCSDRCYDTICSEYLECTNTNGLIMNEDDCACGNTDCTDETGRICYSEIGSGSCRKTDVGKFGYPLLHSGQCDAIISGLYACNNAAISLGIQTPLSIMSSLLTPPGCYHMEGSTTEEESYLIYNDNHASIIDCSDKRECICFAAPECQNIYGAIINNETCKCGTAGCTAAVGTASGLYCHAASNQCANSPPCTNTNGTIANTDTCICGNTECTLEHPICYSTTGGGSCRKSDPGKFGYPIITSGSCDDVGQSISRADCETAATQYEFRYNSVFDSTLGPSFPPGCFRYNNDLYYNSYDTMETCTSYHNTYRNLILLPQCICFAAPNCLDKQTNEGPCLCGETYCTDSSGLRCDAAANQCSKTLECASDPCDVNAACANTAGSHTCTCNNGYNGSGESCTAYEGECTNGVLIALTLRTQENHCARCDIGFGRNPTTFQCEACSDTNYKYSTGLDPSACDDHAECEAGQGSNYDYLLNPYIEQSECLTCGIGTFSAGLYGPCEDCAGTTYQTEAGQSECLVCDDVCNNVSHETTACTASSNRVCTPNECTCPNGTPETNECTEDGATICASCKDGWLGQEGNCEPHTTCGTQVGGATRLVGALSTEAGTCADCASNTYASNGGTNCQAHTVCGNQVGGTTRLVGALSTEAGTCADCAPGTHAPDSGDCKAWQECLAGTRVSVAADANSDAECETCPATLSNYLTPSAETGTVNWCILCDKGYGKTHDGDNSHVTCVRCDAGVAGEHSLKDPPEYNNEVDGSACGPTDKCGAGTGYHVPVAINGNTVPHFCEECDIGKYSNDTNYDACKTCAAGSIAEIGVDNGAVSSGASSCTPCSSGKFSASSTSDCVDCPPNEFSGGGSTSCTACSTINNLLTTGAGQAWCLSCKSGFTPIFVQDTHVRCEWDNTCAGSVTPKYVTGDNACNTDEYFFAHPGTEHGDSSCHPIAEKYKDYQENGCCGSDSGSCPCEYFEDGTC